MTLLELLDVTYSYDRGQKRIVDSISFNLNKGEITLLVGGTGTGKSTIIRIINGLIPHFYGGVFDGRILFNGEDITYIPPSKRVKLGIRTVLQFPEDQLIGNKVESFLKRHLGDDFEKIVKKLSLHNILNKKINELSGGEKQKVAIASVLGKNPRLILFDEPLSQLDAVQVRLFIKLIEELKRSGISILISEHRLNEIVMIADKVVLLSDKKVIVGKPSEVLTYDNCNKASVEEPIIFRLCRKIGVSPSSIGKINAIIKERRCKLIVERRNNTLQGNLKEVLKVNDVWFWYNKKNIVLRGINLVLRRGEFLAVLGKNGSGKSTLLKLIVGLLKPKRGNIVVNGYKIRSLREASNFIVYLPQNPENMFLESTVREEVMFYRKVVDGAKNEETNVCVSALWELISRLADRNPLTLSGGEKFLVALCSVLVKNPAILLLDETTRGLDTRARKVLKKVLKLFTKTGGSVILATNDIDLLSDLEPDRVAVLSNGRIVMMGIASDVLLNPEIYNYGLRLPLLAEMLNYSNIQPLPLNISEVKVELVDNQ